MPFSYPYPRPSVTADCVVIRQSDRGREVLLVRRAHPPFRGSWALPGGFMEMEEELRTTAKRELLEETGLTAGTLQFVGMYDRPDRDPRGRTITAAYLMLTGEESGQAKAGSDAEQADWFEVSSLPPLAFDHSEILADALRLLP